jgi:ABC-type antimicrobial peptide transport system permease subunit
MLIDAPLNKEKEISGIITRSFADYGMVLTTASERLANFNTVENTYLSVFMILGGLGLIIGTIGLAIVLFRNILERRHEFALLSALGLKKIHITRLILAENIYLFLSGLVSGSLAAFLSILPSFLSPGFHTQVLPMVLILLVVLLNGLFWIWIPARSALKGNYMEALKND